MTIVHFNQHDYVRLELNVNNEQNNSSYLIYMSWLTDRIHSSLFEASYSIYHITDVFGCISTGAQVHHTGAGAP